MVKYSLTSHLTRYWSLRRRNFYRSDDPTCSVKALKEGGKELDVRQDLSLRQSREFQTKMTHNLVDQTCELLKWLCNYRKLHNTTTGQQFWQYSLQIIAQM